MNKNLAIGLGVLVIIGIGTWAFTQQSSSSEPVSEATTTPPTDSPTAPAAQTFVTQKDGNYYVGTKQLEEGYVIDHDVISYTTLIHSGDGTHYTTWAVDGAAISTFSTIRVPSYGDDATVAYRWGKDAKHVFYEGQELAPSGSSTPVIDPATFTVIPGTYLVTFGKDANSVFEAYSNGDKFAYLSHPELDPATLQFVGELCAQDKNGFYTIDASGGSAVFTSATPRNTSDCALPPHPAGD